MRAREDKRIVKTKAALFDAFLNLLLEKLYEDITVKEICERADIRRATFYKHFDDKYEFLRYLVGSLRDDFDNRLRAGTHPLAGMSYYVEYLKALVNFLLENEAMINNLLESSVLHTLLDVITEKNYEDTCNKLRESVSLGMILPASVEVTAAMMTGAVANTILTWYNSGRKLPKEELVAEMTSVICRIIN